MKIKYIFNWKSIGTQYRYGKVSYVRTQPTKLHTNSNEIRLHRDKRQGDEIFNLVRTRVCVAALHFPQRILFLDDANAAGLKRDICYYIFTCNTIHDIVNTVDAKFGELAKSVFCFAIHVFWEEFTIIIIVAADAFLSFLWLTRIVPKDKKFESNSTRHKSTWNYKTVGKYSIFDSILRSWSAGTLRHHHDRHNFSFFAYFNLYLQFVQHIRFGQFNLLFEASIVFVYQIVEHFVILMVNSIF